MNILFNANYKQARGFTIVELLIVIVVIGILAAITIVAFNGIQQRGRDAKRVSDLKSVQRSLELYFVDNNRYPATTGPSGTDICISVAHWNCWGANGSTGRLLPAEYAATMPQDPQMRDSAACNYPNTFGTRLYYYAVSSNGQGYRLGTYMENVATSDPNYFDGSTNINCGNFVNYLIRKNF